MAFDLKALVQIGGGSRARKDAVQGTPAAGESGIAVWSYFSATDNKAAIKGAGYFNGARFLLSPGDAIIISENGAAISIITVLAVPKPGSDVTVQANDVKSTA